MNKILIKNFIIFVLTGSILFFLNKKNIDKKFWGFFLFVIILIFSFEPITYGYYLMIYNAHTIYIPSLSWMGLDVFVNNFVNVYFIRIVFGFLLGLGISVWIKTKRKYLLYGFLLGVWIVLLNYVSGMIQVDYVYKNLTTGQLIAKTVFFPLNIVEFQSWFPYVSNDIINVELGMLLGWLFWFKLYRVIKGSCLSRPLWIKLHQTPQNKDSE